jgi:hypothetical protein
MMSSRWASRVGGWFVWRRTHTLPHELAQLLKIILDRSAAHASAGSLARTLGLAFGAAMSWEFVSSCSALIRVRRGAPEGAQPARVGLASASSAVTPRTSPVWLRTNCLAPAYVRSTAATPLCLPQNTRCEHNSCRVAAASLLLRLPSHSRAPWPARSWLAATLPPTPVTRVA